MDKNNNKETTNINEINNPYYSKDTKEKLLFIRHGQTFFNLDPDKIGRKTNYKYIDSKLTEKGIEQSKSLQKTLNELTIEVVYISPMYRAFQTVFYALEKHPDLSKIKVIVHPLVNEVTSCVNDYMLDIKETKKEFNMDSKIKFDWSIFNEYVKGIKWDENFYYFDNFDCFEESKKDEMYQILKNLYDKNDFSSFEKKLGEMDIPDQIISCPLELLEISFGGFKDKYKCDIASGFFGMIQDKKTLTVKPVIGYAIVEEEKETSPLIEKEKDEIIKNYFN